MKIISKYLLTLFFLISLSITLFGQKYTGLTAIASDGKSTSAMFDKNMSSRWQDASNLDNASFVVDLGASKVINTIKIFWENANAKNFTLSFSNDKTSYYNELSYSNMDAGNRTDIISVPDINYRYIKFQGITRALNYGYSIYEFEVYPTDPANFSSNLPIVVITTDNNPSTGKPLEIKDEPKVLGNMKIINRIDGSRNNLSDQNTPEYLNYNGRIGIEFRGSSSQALPKKPYGFTTLKDDNVSNNNVSIFDMPKENDWILNSLAFDPSLIRDFISYELYGKLGNYSPRGTFCEVVINGVYMGLYVFMEKIKADDGRVNIEKMTISDNTEPYLTGGYITKCDKTTGGDPVAWSMSGADFIHTSPKPEEITPQQNTYIYNQFYSLKNVMTAQNSSITTGYPSIIDIPSFVDFMILNEFSSNVDGYQYSTYFHKDRNGKLRAGPIWDFNLTFGNDIFIWGFDRSHTDYWQFRDGGNTGARFWQDLFNNSTFNCYFTKRWIEVSSTGQPLNYTVLSNRIDQIVQQISEAELREDSKWNTIGDFAAKISFLKSWIQTRTIWLNSKLTNYQACTNITLPPLVISKINYNPTASTSYESDSLEYIEITNNGNTTINLTGIYFRELGISYQFPVNSNIAANAKIMLASNISAFQNFYGYVPFDQFTRCLSNKSQKLVLSDAFGNDIDRVEYADKSPWPTAADGGGSCLELIDLNSDNSLASNWKASNFVFGVDSNILDDKITITPIPAKSEITIMYNCIPIQSYEIIDIMGRTLMSNQIQSRNKINIENLIPGTYLLKIHFTGGRIVVKRIIKD